VDEVTRRVTGQLLTSGSSTGPAPDPETMRQYAALVPDAPERLLRIVEAQTVEASARDDRLVDAEIRSAKSGRDSATALSALCILAAIVFLFQDRLAAAVIILVMPAVMFLRPSRDPRRAGK